jgi:hypothetical protein
LLLLVFALLDITSGEPCGDELEGLGEVCVSWSDASAVFDPATKQQGDYKIASPDALSQKSSDNHSHCEECFCCCAHILPSRIFKAEPRCQESALAISFPVFLPSSPPQDTFRPPRFA